jgi:hypothetical protein
MKCSLGEVKASQMAATGVQEVTSLAARYPQRLKPHSRGTIDRSAEALRHPEKLPARLSCL